MWGAGIYETLTTCQKLLYVFFFSFSTPAVLQHGRYYIVSLWTTEETESKRLNKVYPPHTVCKQQSWNLVPGLAELKALGPWVWEGYPFSSNFTSRSLLSSLWNENFGLGSHNHDLLTLWLHHTLKTQVFRWRSKLLGKQICKNPSVYLLATLTSISTPEHTILLFSNSNLSIGGIGSVLFSTASGWLSTLKAHYTKHKCLFLGNFRRVSMVRFFFFIPHFLTYTC